MAGISIQTKNASYYGAINNSKKSATGKVGAFRGNYAKKNTEKAISIQSISTKKSQNIQSNRKQLLEDLEKTEKAKVNLSDLSDKEVADLKAAQIAAEKDSSDASAKAEEMEANKAAKKKMVFVGTSVNKKNGYLDLTKTKEKKADNKPKKKLHYSYKDVSSKIQQAKTSVSAGQAVISAKRKVLELRRKASSGNVDSEDLQLALSHAKKMETIAKRKKHNLEMEEMIAQVKEQDERADKTQEGYNDAQNGVIEAAKDSVGEAQNEITEQRDRYAEELSETVSEEMAEMIEEFGQEEMEMLEETMEMLEQLEVANPHMSDEKFEDLKRKHRASEDKALTKANMEYLKGMMKQLEKESHKSTATVTAPQACPYSPMTIANPAIEISISTGVAVDIDV